MPTNPGNPNSDPKTEPKPEVNPPQTPDWVEPSRRQPSQEPSSSRNDLND